MHWIESHPYAAGILGAAVLAGIGFLVVVTHQPATIVENPSTSFAGINLGASTDNFPPAADDESSFRKDSQQTQTQTAIYDQVKGNPPFNFNLTSVSGNPAVGANEGFGSGFDFDGFMAQLGVSSKTKNTVSPDAMAPGADAYAFIPTALISTSTTNARHSATQQALYDYGNTVGSVIETYEITHRNAAQVLQRQFNDRQSPDRVAAVVQLAQDLSDVGTALAAVEDVPPPILSAHQALAKSYWALAATMRKIPEQQRDSDMLGAINAYDASVASYITHYVALIQIFAAYGVTFAPNESGSVFMFTNAQGI